MLPERPTVAVERLTDIRQLADGEGEAGHNVLPDGTMVDTPRS